MAYGDDVLETQRPARKDQQTHHHGETGEHGAGHEVRWKNCRVPARNHRHGEVETNDGMYGEHQRR